MKLIFFHKTDWLSLVFLYMLVTKIYHVPTTEAIKETIFVVNPQWAMVTDKNMNIAIRAISQKKGRGE